jgi:hypothetical protein
MTKVAADYGVTGTALKKTCDRHHIPTPERGYWAKLEYGKRVNKEALPPLTEPNLATVRISGSSEQHLSPSVREAKEKARDRLHKHAAAKPLMVSASEPALSIVEPPCLAATRRTISKARPDGQVSPRPDRKALSRSKLLRLPLNGEFGCQASCSLLRRPKAICLGQPKTGWCSLSRMNQLRSAWRNSPRKPCINQHPRN